MDIKSLEITRLDKTDGVPTSLIILQHGLHGTLNDYDNFLNILLGYDFTVPTIVLRPRTNGGFWPTMGGVKECSERMVAEVEIVLKAFPSLRQYSIVGHSLGGVIARHSIKKISALGYQLKPIDFIAVSSPFLGVRRPRRTVFNSVFHKFAPLIAGQTGKELLMEDDDPNIMLELTKGDYLSSLRQFKRRAAYGNVFNDMQVPYCTSLFSSHRNPFRGKNAKRVVFLEGNSNIIDMEQSEFRLHPSSNELELTFASDERKRQVLLSMVNNLNSLQWEKFACRIDVPFMAHVQIIFQNRFIPSGKDATKHICARLKEGLSATTPSSRL